MSDKIEPMHLERSAFTYVRQSSLQQVRYHTEGQRQQYALVERALALGFRETILIDEDQGRFGSGQQEGVYAGQPPAASLLPTQGDLTSLRIRTSTR